MVLLKRDLLANKRVGLVETGHERPADRRFFKPPISTLVDNQRVEERTNMDICLQFAAIYQISDFGRTDILSLKTTYTFTCMYMYVCSHFF